MAQMTKESNEDIAEFVGTVCAKIVARTCQKFVTPKMCTTDQVAEEEVKPSINYDETSLQMPEANANAPRCTSTPSRVVEPRLQTNGNVPGCTNTQSREAAGDFKVYTDPGPKLAESIFKDIGLDSETVDIMADANIPPDGIFNRTLVNSTVTLPFDQNKLKLTVESSNKRRRFGGHFPHAFVDIIKRYNKYCNIVCKSNRIKAEDSRKTNVPFWRGKFKCKHSNCSVKIEAIVSPNENELSLIFQGDVLHDIREREADEIRGKERDSLKEMFFNQPTVPPSHVYRSGIANLDSESFMAGNRGSVGVSPNVLKQIKYEARKGTKSSIAVFQTLQTLMEKFKAEDKKRAESVGTKRKLYGFIHDTSTTPNLKVFMAHESGIRLYNLFCQCDCVYIDATGSLVEKLPSYSKILLYQLSVRHPYGKAPPMPVAEYLTSSHSMTSIQSFLAKFREMERSIKSGKNACPKLFVTDQSLAIILAILKEFCNESLEDYMERTYRIATNSASEEDLAKSLLHLCLAHMMQLNKKDMSRDLATKEKVEKRKAKEFGMLLFARLVECKTLGEMANLLVEAKKVLLSKYVTEEVERAVNVINEAISQFPKTEILDDLDDDEENGNGNDCGNEEETSIEEQTPLLFESSIMKYFKEKLGLDEQDSANSDEVGNASDNVGEEEGDAEGVLNSFFMPKYFEAFVKNRLKFALVWSAICLQFSTTNNAPTPQGLKRSVYVDNMTNAYAENAFGDMKKDPHERKLSLKKFLETSWVQRCGLRRQWFDGLLQGKKEEEQLLEELKKGDKKKLNEILEDNVKDQATIYTDPEEQWSKKEKRAAIADNNQLGRYRSANNTDVILNPVTPKKGDQSCQPMNESLIAQKAFTLFKDDIWKTERVMSPSAAACKVQIKDKWRCLSRDHKSNYIAQVNQKNQETEGCICNGAGELLGPGVNYWVECDMCKTWYHIVCVDIEKCMTEAAPFYTCPDCMKSRIIPFLRFVSSCNSVLPQTTVDTFFRIWKSKHVREQEAFCLHDPTEIEESSQQAIQLTTKRGIVNPGTRSCWFNSVIQVICGTTLYDLLCLENKEDLVCLENSDIDDKEKEDYINFCKSVVAIHDKLICSGKAKALELDEDIYTVAKALGHPIVKNGQSWDAVEFYESFLRKINSMKEDLNSPNNLENKFFHYKADVKMCIKCGNRKETVDCRLWATWFVNH